MTDWFWLMVVTVATLLVAPGCSKDEPAVPYCDSTYSISGWFYARAVVTQDGEVAYDGRLQFAAVQGKRGEHTYLGALCGPGEAELLCDYGSVNRTYADRGITIAFTLKGTADDTMATFFTTTKWYLDGELQNETSQEWAVTDVTTTPPETATTALMVEQPRLDDPVRYWLEVLR